MADAPVVDNIIQAESGGNPTARNPRSTATGAGQFLESTWLEQIGKHRPELAEGKSRDEILALREDPELSKEMTALYAGANQRALEAAGHDTSAGNVYLAHHFGATGSKRILDADPNTPIEQVMGAKVLEANPHLRGKTTGEVRDWAAERVTPQGGAQGAVEGSVVRQERNPQDFDSMFRKASPFANYAGIQTRGTFSDAYAAITGDPEGLDRFERFNSANGSSSPYLTALQAANATVQDAESGLTSVAADMIRENPEDAEAIRSVYVDRVEYLQRLTSDPGMRIFYAAAFEDADENATSEDIMNNAVDMYMAMQLEDLEDATPWWKSAKDFLFSFSDFHHLEHMYNIGGGVLGMYSAEEVVRGNIIQFQATTDPLERLQLWEDLMGWAKENLNSTQTQDFMRRFLEEGSAADLGDQYGAGWTAAATIFPVLTLAGAGKALAVKGANGLSRAYDVKKLGDVGRMASRAMRDPEYLKSLNLDPIKLADSSSPVASPSGDNVLAGLPVEIQRNIQQAAQDSDVLVRDIIEGRKTLGISPYTGEEASKIDSSINTQLIHIIERTPGDIASAVVEKGPTPDSVTLTVSVKPKVTDPMLVDEASRADLKRVGDRLLELHLDDAITKAEMDRFVKASRERGSSVESIEAAVKEMGDGLGVDDAITMLDEASNKVYTHTITARFDDTIGAFTQTGLDPLQWVQSHRAAARTVDTVDQVEKALALDNITAKVGYELRQMVDDIYKQLPLIGGRGERGAMRARANINKALWEGSEWVDPTTGINEGKVWSVRELQQNYGMSGAEMQAYYKLRNVYDKLHILKNHDVRRELVRRGYRDIKVNNSTLVNVAEDGTQTPWTMNDIGVPFLTVGEAEAAGHKAAYGVRSVVDAITGEVHEFTRANLALAYANGKTLVRMRNAVHVPGKGKYQHVLVSMGENISDLPRTVLPFRTGYVPRIYDKGAWFVKSVKRGTTVDGRIAPEAMVAKTHGMSSSRAAADALAHKMSTTAAGKNTEFKVYAADQIDPEEMLLQEVRDRLYVSKRGNPVPQYELSRSGELVEQVASTVDPMKALAQNISNIAFHVPRTEWRMAQLERVRKSAQELGVQWNGVHSPATGGGDGARRFIERQREQLRDWLAIPDSNANRWESAIQWMYEKSLATPLPGGKKLFDSDSYVPQALWWLKSNDPLTAARAATFHLMLGLFNPVQLFVQAQGGAVAASHALFSGNPALLGRVYKDQLMLRHVELARDSKVMDAMIEKLKKDGAWDAETAEGIAMARGWGRSGLREGVMTNGDFELMEQGFGSITYAASKMANGPGMFFYRMGELFNRRLSYATSWNLYKQNNPKVDMTALTDKQHLEIVARANDYMLNLGRANRAAWQKGILSLTTQFWQVQAKMIEQYIHSGAGRTLTAGEKLKMMMGQTFFYGAAGIPVAGGIASYGVSQLMLDEGRNDSVMARGIHEGLWGLAFSLTGADISASKRGAVLGDVQNMLVDVIAGDASMSQVLAGAFGALGPRASVALARVKPLAVAAYADQPPLTQNDWLMAVDGIAQMSTSFSNLGKAYIMATQDKMYGRSGQLIDEDKYSLTTLLGTAMGFQAGAEDRAYSLKTLNTMEAAYKADSARAVRRLMADQIRAHTLSGTWSDADMARSEMTIRALTSRLSEFDRVELLEGIHKELSDNRTMFARETNRYIRERSLDFTNEVLSTFEQSLVGEHGLTKEY